MVMIMTMPSFLAHHEPVMCRRGLSLPQTEVQSSLSGATFPSQMRSPSAPVRGPLLFALLCPALALTYPQVPCRTLLTHFGAHLFWQNYWCGSWGSQGRRKGWQANRCHFLGAVGAVPSLPCLCAQDLLELSHLSLEVGSSADN